MEINNKYTNDNFVAQFLLRQDAAKPKTNPLTDNPVKKAEEDAFVSSKDNSQPLEAAQEVKSEDTFVKEEKTSEQIEKSEETEKKEPEKPKEAEETEKTETAKEKEQANVKETDEINPPEEVKEEEETSQEEQKETSEENVKKNTNFIDKIKGFFKNLFMKFKPKKDDPMTKNVSAGGVN